MLRAEGEKKEGGGDEHHGGREVDLPQLLQLGDEGLGEREGSDQPQQRPLEPDDEQEDRRYGETQRERHEEKKAVERDCEVDRLRVFHDEDADEEDADGGGRPHETYVTAAAGVFEPAFARSLVVEHAIQQRADVEEVVVNQQDIGDGQQQDEALKQAVVGHLPDGRRFGKRRHEGRPHSEDGLCGDLAIGGGLPLCGCLFRRVRHIRSDCVERRPERIGGAIVSEREILRPVGLRVCRWSVDSFVEIAMQGR